MDYSIMAAMNGRPSTATDTGFSRGVKPLRLCSMRRDAARDPLRRGLPPAVHHAQPASAFACVLRGRRAARGGFGDADLVVCQLVRARSVRSVRHNLHADIPTCAASSPITVLSAIRSARISRCPATSKCATTRRRARHVPAGDIEPRVLIRASFARQPLRPAAHQGWRRRMSLRYETTP